MKRLALLPVILFLLVCINSMAQSGVKQDSLQVTGMIFDKDSLAALPYAKFSLGNINYLSNEEGQFSFWAKQGEIVKFSYLGFKESSVQISDSLLLDNYLFGVFLTRDTLQLTEVLVLPRYEELLEKSKYMPLRITPEKTIGSKNIQASTNQALTQPELSMDREMNQRLLMKEQIQNTNYKYQIPPNQSIGFNTDQLIPITLYLSERKTKIKKAKRAPLSPNEHEMLLKLFKKDSKR